MIAILILSTLLFCMVVCSAYLFLRFRRSSIEASEKNRQLQATITLLDKISANLTTRLQIEPALKIVADYALHATNSEACAVFLLDEGQHLNARVVRGLFPLLAGNPSSASRRVMADDIRSQRITLGEWPIGFVASSGQPIIVNDCPSDSRFAQPSTEVVRVNTMMAAPLIARGSTLGVIAVTNKRSGALYEEPDKRLLQTLSDLAAVAADFVNLAVEAGQQDRIQNELRMAHEFQLMLLPKTCPKIEGIDLAAYCRPALEVGGDFYDFIPLEEGKYGIVIADASGKGIPGALIMATTRSALRSEARLNPSPGAVLKRVNEQIRRDTKTSVFITMVYGILDPRNKTFTYCRAGHEPPLLCSDSIHSTVVEALPGEGIALGMVEADLFDVLADETITLTKGQTIILYTDGVIEAANEGGEEFGHERFHSILRQSSRKTCSERLVAVVNGITEFMHSVPQQDDITLVAIGVRD